MADELAELLEAAIYKEISAQAWYTAGQNQTRDTAARALMKELAEEESRHASWLKGLQERGLDRQEWYPEKVSNLMVSEHLTAADTIEGAGPQEVLIFAMKREQHAVEFYSWMMGALKDATAKQLCQTLVQEELKHKLKLETLYDDGLYEQQ